MTTLCQDRTHFAHFTSLASICMVEAFQIFLGCCKSKLQKCRLILGLHSQITYTLYIGLLPLLNANQ